MTDEFAPFSDETELVEAHAPRFSEAEIDPQSRESRETFWQMVRRKLRPSPDVMNRAESRLQDLDEAISLNPDEITNYVLRGELFLKSGAYDLALADFQRGLEIANEQIENGDWGIIAQIMQDRALSGIQHIQRQLRMSKEFRS
ncbi:MAG: tetratricopeptide repeat protein [Chitinophagaceae bacterium]|nr:tetratricopeptide repeat protein [Anaerolineae bacterium]